MSTNGKPAVSKQDAESVVRRLQALRGDLTPAEQRVLDSVMKTFETTLRERATDDLLADFPEAAELLDDVAAFSVPEEEVAIGPTITTITVATIAASHPYITCN